MRRFELVEGSSSKFWEVDAQGADLTVRFGRIGTQGQTQTKSFATDAKAALERDKLVKEKTGKGYKEVGVGASPLPKAAPKAPAAVTAAHAAAVVAAPPAPPPEAPAASPAAATRAAAASVGAATTAAAPIAPAADAADEAIAWTPALLASIDAVRGVTPRRPTPDASAAWRAARDRDGAMGDGWRAYLTAGTPLAELTRAALALTDLDELPSLDDPALAGALLGAMSVTSSHIVEGPIDPIYDAVLARTSVAFLVRAGIASLDSWPPHERDRKPRLERRSGMVVWHGARGYAPFSLVRTRLAWADDAAYAAAVVVARELFAARPDDLARTALAYMFPGEPDLAAAVNADVAGPRLHLLTSTRDAAVIAALVQRTSPYELFGQYGEAAAAARAASVLACAGTSPPVVRALLTLYDALTDQDTRRGVASVLARVPTIVALSGLAERADKREALAAITEVVARWPELGVRAIAHAIATKPRATIGARAVLVGALRKDPGLAAAAALTDAERRVVEEVARSIVDVPPADPAEIPAALAHPRWLAARKKPRTEVVVAPLPFTAVMRWPRGLKESWRVDPVGGWLTRARTRPGYTTDAECALEWLGLPASLLAADDAAIVAACAAENKRWRQIVGLTLLSARLARLVSLHLPLSVVAGTYSLAGLGAAAAAFELELVEVAARVSTTTTAAFELVIPFGAASVAPGVARAFAETKKVRPIAERWLRLHPDAATAGLLHRAIGKHGKEQQHAEIALRFVAANGHRDAILDAAKAAGAEALAAARETLDADPLDVVPAKLPQLPSWASAARLTPVVLAADGARKGGGLGPAATEHLLTMLAFSRLDEPYAGLAVARAACTKASLAGFAWDLFSAWLAAGAASKDGWAMLALGHFGDDACARDLAARVREWPGEAAHARAVAGLDVLATIGTDVALMHLHGIAQKLKFKGLQQKAREKIDAIAEARGLTADELADRLVPDLGLDDDGSLTLDFGPRAFKVTFDEALHPVVLDAANKRLPDLPKPKQSDDADKSRDAVERWKALKKDAKTLATLQVLRLELAMCARRRWPAATFRTFLLEHPVLRHLVRRLVWATYGADAKTRALFRAAEDGTLADARDEPFELSDDAIVGVAHPLEIDPQAAAAIGQVFADYEILQPFRQLGRDTYVLTDAERGASTLTRVKGAKVATGRVLGLESRGWRRGEAMDGGGIWDFVKILSAGLEAHLGLEPGIIVGMVAEHPEQTLHEVRLHEEGSYAPVARTFGEIDDIVASELVRDLNALVG
ncbi:MAG TPA: DUF4132 domain-containing protein [Byssovorax sp.]